MSQQKAVNREMTSIRVTEEFRKRLGRIRAEITLETGDEWSMEELLTKCVDAFEKERKKAKGKQP
jgi:hypothetical protein